jgi:hypothetical protein
MGGQFAERDARVLPGVEPAADRVIEREHALPGEHGQQDSAKRPVTAVTVRVASGGPAACQPRCRLAD